MTPHASRLLETVDEMLLDAGQAHDSELRAALLSLGTLASLPAPAPNAELAALLAGPRDQLARQRLRRRHRPAVVGLAVIAGMGLGVTGVAASGSGHRQLSSPSVQRLLEDWAPSWTIAGAPTAAPAARLLTEPQPATAQEAEPAAEPVPAPSNTPETAKPESAQPGAEAGEAAAAEKARTDDGGAAAKEAVGRPDPAPPGDAARKLEKAQELDAGTRAGNAVGQTFRQAIPVPARTDRTGAGKPGPRESWLKKFSR